MASNEDCASVLDAFVHDAANLPLEINHMMEEIQAKDKEMQKFSQVIASKDGSIQKHVKANSGMVPHPKEAEYSQAILKHLDLCEELQGQKIALSEKAVILLDRQIRRLDTKIKDLVNEGLLSADPPLPSLLDKKNQKDDSNRSFLASLMPAEGTPLQITSGNVAHPGLGSRAISQSAAQPASRISQVTQARNSAPGSPASAAQHIQRHRESSAGAADAKRRRLNTTIPNMPAQSSNLRQSSLGPGTPKAGTPGSTRGGSAGPRSIAGGNKKSSAKNIKAPHQQVSKLKGKPSKRLSATGSVKKRGGGGARNSPSIRDDDDSVLSSADVSDVDSQTSRSRRRKKDENDPDVDMEDDEVDENVDEENDQEDTREYCFCHKVSYGEMVGCENEDCPYEWFHLECVGLKRAPSDKDLWYCSECEKKGFKSEIHGK